MSNYSPPLNSSWLIEGLACWRNREENIIIALENPLKFGMVVAVIISLCEDHCGHLCFLGKQIMFGKTECERIS